MFLPTCNTLRRTLTSSKLVKGGFVLTDYAAMYKRLFNSTTDAIAILQQAQQDTEEMYVTSPEPDIMVLESKKIEDDE